MSWHKIIDAFKRLDDRLSDAAYLHGSHLTGQEKIVRSPRRTKHKHTKSQMPFVFTRLVKRTLADSETDANLFPLILASKRRNTKSKASAP